MAHYSYLNPETQIKISEAAKKVTQEAGIHNPPFCHEALFESLNLRVDDVDLTVIKEGAIPGVGKLENSIRGVLCVQEKQIFVLDQSNYQPRRRFTLGHEAGHWILPHHRALLYKCNQFDLSPSANNQLEKEANFFSSELNFFGDQFCARVLSQKLNINNIKKLADKFKMSVEACLRRAVEYDISPSCCWVVDVVDDTEGKAVCIKYAFCSNSFLEKFGKPPTNGKFKSGHKMASFLNDNGYLLSGTTSFEISYKNHPMIIDVWNSGFKVFVLGIPQ